MDEDDFSRYVNNPLWPILVETVHAMVMYKYHKAYVKERLIHEQPNISPRRLAAELGIPLGEALVILYEIRGKAGKTGSSAPQPSTT
ncbi:MAG: hypothetical protein QW502_01745 [Candidatus Bathyarchaeia archaeon]|nr:hypothetical protein [Candidatus Bathyarchaeota archaeon]